MRCSGMSTWSSSTDDLAGVLVLDPRQDLAGDAERRRHDTAGVAGVHALGEHAHAQLAGEQAAQRGRDPEVVVVGASRVEADHEARRADPIGQRLDVSGQVAAAALLAGLDQHDAVGCAGSRRPGRPGCRSARRTSSSRRRRRRARTAGRPRSPAPTGRAPRASRTARAACRGGRRAARCRRPSRRWRAGSP